MAFKDNCFPASDVIFMAWGKESQRGTAAFRAWTPGPEGVFRWAYVDRLGFRFRMLCPKAPRLPDGLGSGILMALRC